MLSFPTTLNKGGSHLITPQHSSSLKDVLNNSIRSAINSSISKVTSGRGYDTDGIRYDVDPDRNAQLDSMNFSIRKEIPFASNQLAPSSSNNSQTKIWSPFKMSQGLFAIVNNYRGYMDNVLIETGNDTPLDEKLTQYQTHNYRGKVTPSLFNPYNGVPYGGIMENLPLLDGTIGTGPNIDENEMSHIDDCSINELVKLSSMENSILGQARYKYADFMYCKDLGKISNNHMITLRRFATPIGDNIFREAVAGNKVNPDNTATTGDIGRMIAWFDTDDNKLSDIMSYEYEATWKELTAKWDQKTSEEDDPDRGLVGKVINNLSPSNNKAAAAGIASGGWISSIMTKLNIGSDSAPYKSNDVALGRNYDQNKVYTPKNTVWDTHIYEGRLKFKHEFTLTFSYKLRAYDNINPKSAFLDLIGNILMTTYHRGRFWGGKNEVLGSPKNHAGWNKYKNIMDGLGKAGGELWDSIFHLNNSPGPSVTNILTSLGNATGIDVKGFVGQLGEHVANFSKDPIGEGKNLAKSMVNGVQKGAQYLKDSGQGGVIMGTVMNKLGRPSIYVFDSLLNGSCVGLWHVTIGNPKNPIAAFGNLIMTNCKVTHSGPLGLDDFPTELKVTVTLKHAMSRDATRIERMYTKGRNNIYLSLCSPFNQIKYSDNTAAGSNLKKKGVAQTIPTKVVSDQIAATENEKNKNKNNKPKIGNSSEAYENTVVPPNSVVNTKPASINQSTNTNKPNGFMNKAMDIANGIVANMNLDTAKKFSDNVDPAKIGETSSLDADKKLKTTTANYVQSRASNSQYENVMVKPIEKMSRYSWCGCDIMEFTSNKDELR